jgi:hypothetical protein
VALDWPSEQYVRLYTRNTPGWLVAPWEGRALLPLLIRALDRNGHLDLGDDPIEGLAATVMLPLEVVEVGLAYWVKRQTVVWSGTVLQMPNYVSAQECTKSDKLRAQEYRARKRVTMRDEASQFVTDPSRIVTERHEKSRDVTRANASSHSVTPPVLCFSVPPNPPTPPPGYAGCPHGGGSA